jgi:hypothetical protein
LRLGEQTDAGSERTIMEKAAPNPFDRRMLGESVLQEWQSLIDLVADIFGLPAGLITRVDGSNIEIFLSSKTRGNPYPEGAKAQYPDSGWYCEKTLKSRSLNLIPDALDSPEWKDNSAATGPAHMVSYIGVPIAIFVNKKTGAPVPNAVIVAKRIDMAPDGMEMMASKIEAVPADKPGHYRFRTDLTMEGGWRLSLGAKVQGETGTLENRLVLKAVRK